MNPINLGISILAVLIAVIAAWFTIRGYRRKSGLNLRGSFTVASSIACDDKYISSITVENLKDRSVVVFKIFLRLGPNYYIEIDDFGGVPFVLKPFEVLHREYEPIDHYSTGTRRVSLNALLEAKSVRRRLVLSTSSGRYVVKRWVEQWDPIYLFFKNYYTAIIQPMRLTLDGRAYGSRAKYVVRVTMSDGKVEAIPIHEGAHRYRVFRGFGLTEESLGSREALEEFLLERAVAGDLNCADLSVLDLEVWRDQAYGDLKDAIELKRPMNWVTYHLIGRAYTWWKESMLRRHNRAHQERRLTALRKLGGTTERPLASADSGRDDSV